MTEETITVGGHEYRRFIPYPEPVTDGTTRCIACGQIDEPGVHDDEQCGMTAGSVDFLGEDLETSDNPAGPVGRVVDRGKSVWCHELKTWPEPFQAIEEGFKSFELRLNDRGFEVGHWLHLREYQFATPGVEAHYTGRNTIRRVTYVLESGFPGLRPGYVIMGLEPINHALPMATAPRDGTTLRLLVDYRAEDAHHALVDDAEGWTIGHNNYDNDGEDRWQLAGWCWSQDHYTEGHGKPLGWLPFEPGAAVTAVAPPCAHHLDRDAVTNLDGDHLCKECADDWVRAEGAASMAADAEGQA